MIHLADTQTIDPAPALTRGLALLDRLQANGPATLEHLAHTCGWPKSSVARLLTSLESAGVIRRDFRSREYHPLKRLVTIQTGSESLRDAAAPILDALCHQTHHTVELHLLSAPDQLVMIDRREPQDAEVSVRARVGSTRNLTEFESLTQTCLAFTDTPPPKNAWHWRDDTRIRVTRKLAAPILANVRREKIATDLGINSNGVRRYAAPLLSHADDHPTLLGCLAVAQVCPPHAIEPDPQIASAVQTAAARFSSRH